MKTSIGSEALTQCGAAFPLKPDGQTDISKYRVASLLKRMTIYYISLKTQQTRWLDKATLTKKIV